MAIIMLISLIVLSLRNRNYKKLHEMMILYYIICFILIYEGIKNKDMNNINIFILNYNLKIDYMTFVLKSIILIFMINYIYIGRKFFDLEKMYIREYMLIIWIMIIGVFFLIMSNEFFIIYLALELQNLILYMLASLRRWRSKSIESGMKYYIMGSFSSGLLLYGIIMLFGYFGTLDLIEILYLITDNKILNIELIYIIFICMLILIGLLFKLGVAPFHWWIPEVYEGSAVVITLFFSIVPKLSLLIILYKLYIYIIIHIKFFFEIFFLIVCIISLIIGFFFSLYQKKIIKFLAYSSIFNAGFFMACFSNGTFLSLISLFYFFIPYIFTLLGIFFIIIVFRKIKNEKFDLLWDFSLMANSNMLLSFILAVFFFSLAGIPPLSGFFGKFFILVSIFLNKFYLLFFILLIFSVFGSFYYFRVVRFIFFSNYLDYVFIKPYLNTFLLSIYFFITVFFMLFFDYIYFFFFNILIHYSII